MEEFQAAREKALHNLRIADHMTSVTYPLLKDNKLLIAAMENLFLSVSGAMSAILLHDRTFKRVPPFADTFEVKFTVFRTKCMTHHGIGADSARLIQELREILVQRKKSPIEFSRRDTFVICSDDYRIRTLTHRDVKDFVARAKVFIHTMVKLTGQHEGIFGGS
ncbi:hypothetical protein J4439_03645 [Candidatus Woesearchaeota archaeon]|nr:hypothetical protein [Candidatus Woesearchaeota archaeon]